jgi:hypothetical protein
VIANSLSSDVKKLSQTGIWLIDTIFSLITNAIKKDQGEVRMTENADANTQVCPVCQVKILKRFGGDLALFSAGAPGTREILFQKVCQHTKNPACINRNGGIPVVQNPNFKL